MPSSLIKSPIGARPRDPASDLTATMRFLSTAWLLGWDDVQARYRRTLLGPMWIVASNAIWIGTLTYLTAALFDQDLITNLVYIGTGLVCFSYMTSSMIEATIVFLRAKNWISSTQFPLAIHAFRALFGWLITLAHQSIIIVLAFVIAGFMPSATAFLSLVGLLIVNVMLFGLALLFGSIGARFRDLTHILASLTTLFFIITPIFWFKTLLPPGHPIFTYNPMYYFMEIMRAPLLGEIPPMQIWLVAGSIAIGTLGLGLITFYRSFKSIMLWL